MGCVQEVGADAYPDQAPYTKVKVCFNYDTSRVFSGRTIRDDMTPPGRTIIQLDDGRVVLGVECQYSLEGEQCR